MHLCKKRIRKNNKVKEKGGRVTKNGTKNFFEELGVGVIFY